MAETPEVGFSGADRFLRAALSGLAARQRAVASNVANIDTPNFKSSEVRFEETLRQAISGRGRVSGPGGALSQTALNTRMAQARATTGTQTRADGNNVDIDKEMLTLSETTLEFNAVTQLMASRAALVRSVISGR